MAMGMGRRLPLLLALGALLAPAVAHAVGPPTIPAVWVTGVTSRSAVLRAEVNPQGQSTRYHFEYLTLAAYEANLAAGHEGFDGAAAVPSQTGLPVGAGSVAVPVAFNLISPANPLVPATAYRYRVVATNEAD